MITIKNTHHPEIPSVGFYKFREYRGRLANGKIFFGEWMPVKVTKEVTSDPDFPDNIMDRSPQLRMYVLGRLIEEGDWGKYWPWCLKTPISEDEYFEELKRWI